LYGQQTGNCSELLYKHKSTAVNMLLGLCDW